MRRRLRYALPAALVLSWATMLPLLWRAFTTVPSAERLQRSEMVRIPTFETVKLHVGMSAIELLVLLVLVWPGRWRRLRLWAGALGAWTWFLATTPLGINTVQWVHRRWLAAVALALLLLALALTLRALTAALTSRQEGE